MAHELSSNWKKLQAQFKSLPTTAKRKADDDIHSRAATRKHRAKKLKQRTTLSPPLSLFTPDLTPGPLSEAFRVGLARTDQSLSPTQPNAGLSPSIVPGRYLALDCEMVGIGFKGSVSALARVSIVDFHGNQVYDSYVRPRKPVTDWRTRYSGVSAEHMFSAREFSEVQAAVAELLKGRILVGHDLKNDLTVLELTHGRRMMRDTAVYSGFRKGRGTPALRVLTKELLGLQIQKGQHSSLEDARATMLLFRRDKAGFDAEMAGRYPKGAQVKSTKRQDGAVKRLKKAKRKRKTKK